MHFDIERSIGGGFLWRLVSGSGEILAASDTLATKRACQDAIATVKREAAGARVHDHTGDIHRPSDS